jgi:SAM-dependent methyltransferase
MKILIYGVAKTGTTALTYAVENSLPPKENYKIFFEPSILEKVNYSLDNIIVKSLKVQNWEKEIQYIDCFDKKIIIIRHPFDTIVSRLLYNPHNGTSFSNDYNTKRYISLLKEKTKNPDQIDLKEIIDLNKIITGVDILTLIYNFYNDVFEISQHKKMNFFVFRYEDYIEGNLSDINQYLGVKLKTKIEVPAQYKKVARTKNHSDWKNWFTENDVKKLRNLFAYVTNFFGYTTKLDNTHKIIAPETSYLYVISVINEYRKNINLPEYEDGTINVGKEGNYVDKVIQCLRDDPLEKARGFLWSAFNLNPNLEKTYSLLEKRINGKKELLLGSSSNTDKDMFTIIRKIINPAKVFNDVIFGYNIESPNQGYSTNVSKVFFKGWVLPRHDKKAEIVIEGNSISQTFPCDVQRDDVTKKILGQISPNIKCGFRIDWNHMGIFNISFIVEGEKMLVAKIKITSCRETEIVSQELYRIENSIRDSTSRDKLFEELRCCLGLDDFGMLLWSMPNTAYPKMSEILPKMATNEIQRSWTGSSGTDLLKKNTSFVRSVAHNFCKLYGNTLDNKSILDFGCGYGRIARLMYYFTNSDNFFGVDPWDKPIDICRSDGLPERNFLLSDYFSVDLPTGERKFALIYAFSAFTHLSKRATITAIETLLQHLDSSGLLVITIRPLEYWNIDRNAQLLRLVGQQISLHQENGFSFLPHSRPEVDGDITYGDTSMSLDWLKATFPKAEIVGVDRSLDDPFQVYVFLRSLN